MYKSALTVNDILSEQQTVKLQCAKIASAVFLQNTGRSVVVSSCVKICARQRNKKKCILMKTIKKKIKKKQQEQEEKQPISRHRLIDGQNSEQ